MKKIFSLIILILTASVITFFLSACAYKLSSQTENLPGNVKSIQIPLFKNGTGEVNAETYFTNALKVEALRAKFVTLKNDESEADAVLQGRLISIDVIADESSIKEAKDQVYLPTETVIATQYKVIVGVELVLTRSHTTDVLWRGNFVQEKDFSGSQITLPVINTANSLYNESAKRQTLSDLSKNMMQAAFDRMVENF